jgi:hypothetical protein
MHCENPNCHCQSEPGLVRDGHEFCSEQCLGDDSERAEACRCGHAGCSAADDVERAEPEAVRV